MVNPGLVLSSLTSSTCVSVPLLSLLSRHIKCVEVPGSFYSQVMPEDLITVRNTRLLEVLVLISTYYWRRYYSSKL